MLSYPIPEAEELLTNKLSAAQQSLSNCEEDMDFLREQVTVRTSSPFSPDSHLKDLFTFRLAHHLSPFLSGSSRIFSNGTTRLTCLLPAQTMEVATARVYNWDIGQKRKEEAAAA
jgi:hypothetical protein